MTEHLRNSHKSNSEQYGCESQINPFRGYEEKYLFDLPQNSYLKLLPER